ncbi:type I-D CRISPR-associated protein Cas7/Csc2 [Halorubrum ezzemoulense]|uniref:type I-D CRISPR-associated protein Cas7/Csc2 n=1 Tax=Halorubrum ezzemoulense TaxID=337243 RepID=UPI00232D29A5|nr:type I-D CRISPR-associated protein Cas7/Csc2 [Halorubrum ezzemoulense]MDB9253958.1 type I-D CRISPR-associated protein Cas7/Csc2 [Halorubrum ezzemoulense]MDB9257152.1 type I-D CRISPR-associated protein Cas7/Csc2 [Halorubrum ezzemoulense]MDB9277962.1 type I-D CRISPR-associated protein Cas7/Csc2 [Halorubrum ezzemoulense]
MTLQYPDIGLEESFDIYRKRKPSVTLVVRRNVTEPTLFRNSSHDRAETQEFGDKLHAQVNGEKFTSKERLTGLSLLRELDDEFVDDDYAYNEPTDLDGSLNVGTLTYGLAGTGDQDFAIKSRVVEGYTYTTDEYDLMNKETRNAVYESGTMRDDDGNQSEALFDFVKVQPGNDLVHFITLEAATGPMLLYTLHNILNTGKYGARETRTGRNIRNEILGVLLGNHDTSLSTGELLLEYHDEGDDLESSIGEYISTVERTDWEVYGELDGADPFPEWFERLKAVASREADDADEALREEFADLMDAATDVFIDDD